MNPKPSLRLGPLASVAFALLLPCLLAAAPRGDGEKVNPFDFTGPYFLAFYLELAVLAIATAVFLRWRLRGPGGEPPLEALELHPYEIAYLAGKEELAVNTALAALVHQEALQVRAADRSVLAKGELPGKAHPMEQAVHAAARREMGRPIQEVHQAAARQVRSLYLRLAELGLVVPRDRALAVRLLPMVPILALATFGGYKIAVGLSRDKPVAFLIGLVAVTATIGILGILVRPHRTRRGSRALAHLKKKHSPVYYTCRRWPRQIAETDLMLAVALFGISTVAVGPLADLRTALHPIPSSSGGCGGGGGGCGGGGGGCGGGGCGGCGG